MNVERICTECNPSKFVVVLCIWVFTILLALKEDGVISLNYWIIFAPLWVWKGLVVLGGMIGSLVWWRHPHYRIEGEAYVQYKAMIITLALHLLLFLFELLVCDNLSSHRHFWILVFIPLVFISIISIAICIWAVKNDRSFDLELFCSVNILQFIFLALRLDNFIQWEWEVVFVPLWILLCVSLVGVLYSIIFAGIIFRAPEVSLEQRRNSTRTAVAHTFLIVPVLVFQVLLTNKLDGDLEISYLGVVAPLSLTYAQLLLMSFSNRRSNRWWFGLRKNLCHFILELCPCFQEYCNISYTIPSPEEEEEEERRRRRIEEGVGWGGGRSSSSESNKLKSVIIASRLNKPIVPIVSIETPD